MFYLDFLIVWGKKVEGEEVYQYVSEQTALSLNSYWFISCY